MHSHRRSIFRAFVLVLVIATAAPAQVGGPATAPATLWNFLGIPQGIRKLRGATANRRGNNPQREPKPPLKAIADPENLESPDKSIKKAAEVKQAEDLKKQKIKAVKYLASIGCGCYDVDGGVTEALVASMEDCTEDVRYETIKAISDAAEGECCSKCGKVCCCNKDILTQMSKTAYERDDTGCYVEPSERVREAAAEALVICCPNDSPPVIMEDEPRPDRETLDPDIEGDDRETEPAPLPEGSSPFEELPSGDSVTNAIPPAPTPEQVTQRRAEPVAQTSADSEGYGFGVVVHVSTSHQLAHVHFHNPALQAPQGTVIGVYQQNGERRKLLAKLKVVESFRGSANVTGTADALSSISRGDIAVRPPANRLVQDGVRLASDDKPSSTTITATDAADAAPRRLGSLRTVEQVFPATSLVNPASVRKPVVRTSASQERAAYRGFVR